MRDVEKVIEGLKQETIREITKKDARPQAQLAWYWTYIGSPAMAQQLWLINDARRQELYREVDRFKPKYKVQAAQEAKPNHLAAVEMGAEGNYNQIDGIINNEAPKPSLRDTLRQYQEEAGKQDTQPPGKHPEQGR